MSSVPDESFSQRLFVLSKRNKILYFPHFLLTKCSHFVFGIVLVRSQKFYNVEAPHTIPDFRLHFCLEINSTIVLGQNERNWTLFQTTTKDCNQIFMMQQKDEKQKNNVIGLVDLITSDRHSEHSECCRSRTCYSDAAPSAVCSQVKLNGHCTL